MTLGVLLPALDAFLEAAREVDRQDFLQPLERGLEHDLMQAFAEQERRFLRLFRTLRILWPEPVLHEAIEPRDWEPMFTIAELATLRLFTRPLSFMQRAVIASGARAAIADVGLRLSFDLAHPEAVAYLERVTSKVTGINETTRAEIRSILIKGTEEGWSYDRMAKEIGDKFKAFRTASPQLHIRSRAHLIAVTEIGDAYAQGGLIVGHDLQRAGLTMQKMWLDVEDDLECPICQGNAAEGWIPLDQPFSSGHDAPTAHPACVIGETLVDARAATAISRRWYDREVIVIRTASGNKLTCTPNHPVLTPRGWVAAGLLNERDDVISHCGVPRAVDIYDDDQYMPTAIHEIAEAARRSGNMATREVPLSAEDFHGDAADGEIAVIWSNRLLGDDLHTVAKCGHDLTLQRRRMVLGTLAAERSFAQRLERLGAASTGSMGGEGVTAVLLGRSSSHHESVSSERVTSRHAQFHETLSNDPTINSEFFPEGQFGFPADIFSDHVIDVDRKPFHGYVYNLEMPNGWYVANGILTHNCRCDVQQQAVFA